MGVTSFSQMQAHLSVGTACGSCTCEVKKIMQAKLEKELGSRVSEGFTTDTQLAY